MYTVTYKCIYASFVLKIRNVMELLKTLEFYVIKMKGREHWTLHMILYVVNIYRQVYTSICVGNIYDIMKIK